MNAPRTTLRDVILRARTLPAVLGCALALLLTGTVQADPIEDFRLWGNLTVQGAAGAKGSAGENWRLYMEVQPRFRDSGKP